MWGNSEAMDCLSSKITCPLGSTVLDTRECAVGIMRRRLILLKNNCIYVIKPLPLYGWNEASPQHVQLSMYRSELTDSLAVIYHIASTSVSLQ